jgi:hypothetical protein
MPEVVSLIPKTHVVGGLAEEVIDIVPFLRRHTSSCAPVTSGASSCTFFGEYKGLPYEGIYWCFDSVQNAL